MGAPDNDDLVESHHTNHQLTEAFENTRQLAKQTTLFICVPIKSLWMNFHASRHGIRVAGPFIEEDASAKHTRSNESKLITYPF